MARNVNVDLYGKWCLILYKAAKPLSRVAVPSCIATSNRWETQFLHVLTGICIFLELK